MTPPRCGLRRSSRGTVPRTVPRRTRPPEGGNASGPAKPVPRRLLGRGALAGLFLALACGAGSASSALRSEVLDDFAQTSAWQAIASDQVKASLRRDGDGSLCLDYDFSGVSGYAVMRRELPLQWPQNFDLRARLKASGAVNDFQFKLVDSSGDNVWWTNRPNAALPATLDEVLIRRRHIDFAWGPTAERSLRHTRFVEFVVAAGRQGGKGALCLARLRLNERESDPAVWPAARERASAKGLDIDFGLPREFNGITLRWPAGIKALDYDVLASDDARQWRRLRRVRGSDGGLDALFLPESETRHLRVALRKGAARPQVTLQNAALWPTLNATVATLAAETPRGELPRAFVGQQNYWTLVGVDGGGQRSALISEDGALEIGRGGYSIEPAVQLDNGRRITWADAKITHSLREGHLPMPSVHWQHDAFALQVEAAADGPREAPELLARYTLRNTSARAQRYTVLLALRPWQVNPPQQFLSTPGGVRPVSSLQWRGQSLAVNGGPGLSFTERPAGVTAAPFDGGLGLAALVAAPALDRLHDPQMHASALLQFHITLAPGGSHTLGLVAPLGARVTPASTAQLQTRTDAVAAHWRARLNRVSLQLPASAQPIADTLRSALAQILLSREGPALRPGTRSYARSWVRDGAMMVAGLVRLGELDAAREFVDWFAGHIFASGKVPCCVDERGADPVVENDSHGQYLFAVAELMRHGGDRAFAQRHWPQVQRVVAWMEALRQSERTAANQTPERAHLFGLLPPSISHEGYSDKAAYSYWDDFWGLRGYKDAVMLARAVGDEPRARQWAAWRDEFEHELAASVSATAARHGIAHVAGAADRGDFDATSTTIALNPAQAALPPDLVRATFERYWLEMSARANDLQSGRRRYKDYTPYELRNVGALVQLGWPDRAHTMLDFFFKDQRPQGWNQWAEVVLPDAREARFLGDMPHAWVSSDYIRSVLDLFVLEQEREGSLLIGAGLRSRWLDEGDLGLRGLSTAFGTLDWSLSRSATGWQLSLPRALQGLRQPVRLAWPAGRALPRAVHQGQALAWQGRELPLPTPPFTIELIQP